MCDLSRTALVHQHQRLARRHFPIVRIPSAAVITGSAFLYIIFMLRQPTKPLTRRLSKSDRRKHAPHKNHEQVFHTHLPSCRILYQDSGSTDTLVCAAINEGLERLLVSTWSLANLLQQMAQAQRVARRAAIARVGIDARKLANRRCKGRRLYCQ